MEVLIYYCMQTGDNVLVQKYQNYNGVSDINDRILTKYMFDKHHPVAHLFTEQNCTTFKSIIVILCVSNFSGKYINKINARSINISRLSIYL